ncbi:glycosyltransferase family 4 protein [Rubritalea marina]|uniref:glycosyltransferase family 4 protein n=1 Tax=Rubritalea marina TaxID=361055 RepID=UPI0003710E43|nr:glycosyltransferase family 4 protein [Rubritalea marina]
MGEISNQNLGEVWHISWEFPPHHRGGLGIACLGLTEALIEAGVSCRVFYPGAMGEVGFGGEPIDAYCGPSLNTNDPERWLEEMLAGEWLNGNAGEEQVLRFSRWVLAQLKYGRPSLVHAHDWHAALAGVALQRLLGIPLVLHMHSSHVERMGLQVNDALYRFENWAMQQANQVVAVSGLSAGVLSESYGLQERGLTVIANGIHQKRVSPSDDEGAEEKRIDILWVGRLCLQKNPVFMLELFRLLWKKQPRLRLRMVGEGTQKKLLQQLIDFRGLRDAVQLLPTIGHEWMPELYADASLLCMTSSSEPFGLVALEAAAEGVVPILTEACGVREVLPSAPVLKAGEMHAWEKQILGLLDTQSRRQALQQAVQKEAASATWTDAAEKCVSLYRELLNR